MRQITINNVINIFKYQELNEKAKENAKQWYLDGQEPCIFSSMCKEQLDIDFPNSDLNVEYQLSYCQGDGLNIYGLLDLQDIFKNTNDFTEEEKNKLNTHTYDFNTYPIFKNRFVSISNKIEFADDWIEDLEWRNENESAGLDIDKELIYKFETIVKEIFIELCGIYERWGYDYFYEIDDETMEELCDCNEYEFLENGSFYY